MPIERCDSIVRACRERFQSSIRDDDPHDLRLRVPILVWLAPATRRSRAVRDHLKLRDAGVVGGIVSDQRQTITQGARRDPAVTATDRPTQT